MKRYRPIVMRFGCGVFTLFIWHTTDCCWLIIFTLFFVEILFVSWSGSRTLLYLWLVTGTRSWTKKIKFYLIVKIYLFNKYIRTYTHTPNSMRNRPTEPYRLTMLNCGPCVFPSPLCELFVVYRWLPLAVCDMPRSDEPPECNLTSAAPQFDKYAM